ncbi:MAG: LON peptidase substrate-binding domain-containing protein [Gammaproteobacteria bacterium]|nr:LON peptidase substrate-binding domain-containing protein [Gammaproteobacteria bacterium]
MTNELRIPLFALHTVLYPGGPLPLRIFEPRYLDMVSACLRQSSGFGVCLIRSGKEVGMAAQTYEVGTLSTIVDWHMRHDGLLGVTVCGQQRFRIISEQVQPNQLTVADVELIPPEPEVDVPAEYLPLVDLLRQMIEQIGHHYSGIPKKFADASWTSCRLAELLPIPLVQKQHLLQLDNPLQRLDRLGNIVEQLGIR